MENQRNEKNLKKFPRVIAISGWKGSGKDTLASFLVEKGFGRVSFADPLKDSVAQEFGIPRDSLDDPARKEAPILNMPVNPQDGFSRMIADFMKLEFRDQNGKKYGEGSIESIMYWTPRALAILKGSTNRSVLSNFWVQKAIQSIRLSSRGLHAISDLRYQSEVSQLKEAFGEDLLTIRVRRFETSPSTDPSERDLDNHTFDVCIDNTGSIEDLRAKLDELLVKLKGD